MTDKKNDKPTKGKALKLALTRVLLVLIAVSPFVMAIASPAMAQTATPDANYSIDLSPVASLLDQVGELIPSLVGLVIKLLPAIVIFGIIGFILGFLDDILLMFTSVFKK
jgi:hypothetical protein